MKFQLIFYFLFLDDALPGYEPNTVSLRREIPVLDRNDNPPQFMNRPYSFTVAETARVGAVVYEGIIVTDADGGVNGEVTLECDRKGSTPDDACDTFAVNVVERSLFPVSTAGQLHTTKATEMKENVVIRTVYFYFHVQ